MSKKLWKLLDILKTLAFFFILIIGILALLSTSNAEISNKITLKPFTVLSGSMRPTIYEGAMVFINRADKNYTKGNIITFIRPDNVRENVTHRIIKTESIDGKTIYQTKGDANKTTDSWSVRPDAVWGKVIFTLPLVGYVINFSKTKLGVILTIALPLTIIILDEIRIIYSEVKKRQLKKLKTQNSSATNIIILLILTPLLFIFSAGNSFAFFSSTAMATDLIIQTSSWNPSGTPTQTPTPTPHSSCEDNTEITISGNGAGSTNTVNISSNCATTITQTSAAGINSNINISSSNSANPN